MRRPTYVVAAALLLLPSACSQSQDEATSTTSQPPETSTTAALETAASPAAATSGEFDLFDPFVITVNVDITDAGYEPASVFVPLGRSVQLILRNRTATEHHYRVVGMEVEDLLWVSEPAGEIEEGVSEEDHFKHHMVGYVNWRGTSPAGIKPTLDEVHAYAAGGNNDVVRFTPLSVGTFTVNDPLHPELSGSMTVFE